MYFRFLYCACLNGQNLLYHNVFIFRYMYISVTPVKLYTRLGPLWNTRGTCTCIFNMLSSVLIQFMFVFQVPLSVCHIRLGWAVWNVWEMEASNGSVQLTIRPWSTLLQCTGWGRYQQICSTRQDICMLLKILNYRIIIFFFQRICFFVPETSWSRLHTGRWRNISRATLEMSTYPMTRWMKCTLIKYSLLTTPSITITCIHEAILLVILSRSVC